MAPRPTQYAKAIDQWKRIWQGEGPTFLQALGPRPQYADCARRLGRRAPAGRRSARRHRRRWTPRCRPNPANPHALFLRARAKELAGQKDAALADYNLASRTAFAAAQDLASGEAHLYRGIVLFRRKDFARAEEEFASALNFEMTDALLPDARAWRHLSAVAAGSCGPARQSLSVALDAVSPFFPATRPAPWPPPAAPLKAPSAARRCVLQCRIRWHLKASIKSFCWAISARMPRPNLPPAEFRFPSLPWRRAAANKDQQSGEWKDITDWHNIVMWRTENVANFLLKGKQIYLEGRLETRSYEDKEGQKKYFTEVVCEAQNLVLLGGGGGRGDGPSEGSGDYDRPVSMPRSAQRPQAGDLCAARGFQSGHHRRRRSVLKGIQLCRTAISVPVRRRQWA